MPSMHYEITAKWRATCSETGDEVAAADYEALVAACCDHAVEAAGRSQPLRVTVHRRRCLSILRRTLEVAVSTGEQIDIPPEAP